MKNIELKENERIDDLNRNGFKIIQHPKRFCFGMDAVLLSAFAKAGKKDRVMDLGTGTGVIPILMAARGMGKSFDAIDISEESVEMAKRSVELNNIENMNVEVCDIKEIKSRFNAGIFNVVTSNPPYMNKGGGLINEFDAMAVARHEILVTLDDVIEAASWLLNFGGHFYMVHRPHRLADIIVSLRKNKLEPKTIQFVQPYENREANMVLIESTKGGKAMAKVLPPIIVYKNDGSYTENVRKLYED